MQSLTLKHAFVAMRTRQFEFIWRHSSPGTVHYYETNWRTLRTLARTCPQTQAPDPARCVSEHAPRTHQAEPARGQHLKSVHGPFWERGTFTDDAGGARWRALRDGVRQVCACGDALRFHMLERRTSPFSARARNWLMDWNCVPWFHA